MLLLWGPVPWSVRGSATGWRKILNNLKHIFRCHWICQTLFFFDGKIWEHHLKRFWKATIVVIGWSKSRYPSLHITIAEIHGCECPPCLWHHGWKNRDPGKRCMNRRGATDGLDPQPLGIKMYQDWFGLMLYWKVVHLAISYIENHHF